MCLVRKSIDIDYGCILFYCIQILDVCTGILLQDHGILELMYSILKYIQHSSIVAKIVFFIIDDQS